MNRVLDTSNEFENVADNRFSSGQGYSYDLNGNVTQDAAGQRFGYDAENHQKEFFVAGNSGSTPDATYLYEYDLGVYFSSVKPGYHGLAKEIFQSIRFSP